MTLLEQVVERCNKFVWLPVLRVCQLDAGRLDSELVKIFQNRLLSIKLPFVCRFPPRSRAPFLCRNVVIIVIIVAQC